ncbi:uncharacterized protein LOC134273349 [Saccostrea cucullata]|uniref:uncharacterized protein LOC134273349 n=1 Tax=Saccostrea cuccullata TaxID=36930 RepID=UPI002ED4F58C
MQIGVAESMLRMRSGKSKVVILNEVPRIKGASIKNVNGTKIVIDKSSSLCDVYESFAPCEVGQRCKVSSGTVVCVEVSKDSLSDKFIYIVVLGVSIPLVIVAIILVIVCKCHYMRQLKTEKEKNLDNKNPRTGASGNLGGMDSGSQRTTDYDSINHKNVYRREYLELKDTNAYSSKMSSRERKETGNQGCDNPDYKWDFIYETLDPDEKFQIKRPHISSNMMRHY